MLEPFGPSLYRADGPTVPFFGFLARRKPAIRFDAELGEAPDSGLAADIDQVIFRSSFLMEDGTSMRHTVT